MIEPWVSAWARFVWGRLHHEPFAPEASSWRIPSSGPLSGALLRIMDDIGNRRFGVALPHKYWSEARGRQTFERLGLPVEAWITDLGLYPGPLDWIFGRSLHFVARLGISPG